MKIDGKDIECKEGASVLRAARDAGIYIPALCSHPDLLPLEALKPSPMVYRGED